MSSTTTGSTQEIELLERVLLRLGCADTDEKLELCVNRFLTPVILKITSPHDSVRNKVVEVLTHIKRRITSRPQIQIPVDVLLDLYRTNENSAFLQNFVIIFITMGYPRLPLEQRSQLASKVVACEQNAGSYQDKLFMLLIPDLGEIILPADPAQRTHVLKLEEQSTAIKRNFLLLLQDVLLFPYGYTADQQIPGGLSQYTLKRLIANNWRSEELEKIKKGIVRFICSGVFNDKEIFILLVLASADTRYSVATPAIAELSKVCTMIEFDDVQVTAPLYTLFLGNNATEAERKTMPCCNRIRQKLLFYLNKCRGRSVNPTKGLQVVFDGMFSVYTNLKCRLLSLQFAINLIKESPKEFIDKVAKILLNGFNKLVGEETNEPAYIQNAAYSALAQLALTCPHVINQDLKIVLTYFNHLTNSSAELHSAIREALVAMAPAFVCETEATAATTTGEDITEIDNEKCQLNGQQHLLMAMLCDNAESKVHIVQNVTSVFLTTCYPEYYAPARYLLLLIAGERNSLHENITTYLYGVSKKDHINYNILTSIEHLHNTKQAANNSLGKLNSGERQRIILPSFRNMMHYIHEMSVKRLKKNSNLVVVGRMKLPYTLNVYQEILDYLRVCLWCSAEPGSTPGDMKHMSKLQEYIKANYQPNDDNELHQYMKFIQNSIEAKRSETNLLCLYDILCAVPELMAKQQMHLLEPLNNSLKDVSEVMRNHVAQLIGILWAYDYNDQKFDEEIADCLKALPQRTVEHKHGWLLVMGHAFSRKLYAMKVKGIEKDFDNWQQFIEIVKVMAKMLCESQWLLVLAAVKCFSMVGKMIALPNVNVEITIPMKNSGSRSRSKTTSAMDVDDNNTAAAAAAAPTDDNAGDDDNNVDDDDEEMMEFTTQTASTKQIIFGVVFGLLRSTNVRLRIREEAAKCLGNLCIGDGKYFTQCNLNKFLTLVKTSKDATLNIAIADALASTLCGYDVSEGPPNMQFSNAYCDDKMFEDFLNSLVRLVNEPNPHCRQSCSVWLLAVVKHCSYRPSILQNKQLLQFAFTELLSDESEFVQDVASRGLGLVYNLCSSEDQNDLANSLLDQLIGGKRSVKKVNSNTELFAEGMLGKTPTGGNITTYKELCGLASDLNQPDMIYQFMQLANHNASWTSKLGAAFGLKSLSDDSKLRIQPYLGKIIPRLYRYKYDPTPKIQNSMISIWDAIVYEPKQLIEKYYWEILEEIIENLTFHEWRVRISCCLAVRDLLKQPNGLRLRTDDLLLANKEITQEKKGQGAMDTDSEVPEPELKQLWSQLFRVMDDIHEGTRLAAGGTATFLSKLCVTAASAEHGKSGSAIAASILPLILDKGVMNTVADIRKISIKTVSDMIESSGSLIAPHLPLLVPAFLKATGELDSAKLSYLSNRLAADQDAQENVDSLRAEAAKSHHTTETISKCIRFIDYAALDVMTPAVLDLIKTSVHLGTKIACAHFVCLISIHLGKEMTPLVGKYLGACFTGLKDRNATVRKYYASAIGHLIGIAKEQSIKNLFSKLSELYAENSGNRSIPLVIQSINKRHSELLKDYLESVLPLIFFAMHEEQTEENKANIELWRDLWNEITPGDAGIRMNLSVIIPKLEASLNDASWLRKTQAANAINTVAIRLAQQSLEEGDRLRLIDILLRGLHGRTFQGKERLLQALAALCKGLNRHQHQQLCESIVAAAIKECQKREPHYRTLALRSMGDILETLEVDRFEEIYKMIWHLVYKKDYKQIIYNSDDDDDDNKNRSSAALADDKTLSIDERNKQADILNKLKEAVCETMAKAWPKHSVTTQNKYQEQFVNECYECLSESTRSVQISLLVALNRFAERLIIWNDIETDKLDIKSLDEKQITEQIEHQENTQNFEKKAKVEFKNEKVVLINSIERNNLIRKICTQLLAVVTYAAGIPHTGMKKEALNIILLLVKRFSSGKLLIHLELVKDNFNKNLSKFQQDHAPEVRCRLKDIEEKLSKVDIQTN